MPEDIEAPDSIPETEDSKGKATKARDSKKKKSNRKKSKSNGTPRKRTPRPYPSTPFQDCLILAEAIHQYASGERVRRLTLLKALDKSPTSSTTKMLITNSAKYGLTTGSYVADWLDLTELGAGATNLESPPREKLESRFKLAIEGIPPFQYLYSEYRGKRLPTHEVLKDVLVEGGFEIEKPYECVDLFIVNVKFLGLLQTIAGSETLIPIEQALDELGEEPTQTASEVDEKPPSIAVTLPQAAHPKATGSKIDWSKTCFVITPIGEDGSETRQHADLFLGHLIEPALREFDLQVVRADKIGAAGMITSQILEYVMRSRLAIVDLSHHNPNAFYEMAIRHACGLPIVQISRKEDKLPFDVNQVRTVVIDTSSIYTLVPKLETYRSEIATQVRAVLGDGSITSNPISVFFPGFEVVIPKEK